MVMVHEYFQNMWKETVAVHFNVLSLHLPRRAEKTEVICRDIGLCRENRNHAHRIQSRIAVTPREIDMPQKVLDIL
jgi:hypothetical protein